MGCDLFGVDESWRRIRDSSVVEPTSVDCVAAASTAASDSTHSMAAEAAAKALEHCHQAMIVLAAEPSSVQLAAVVQSHSVVASLSSSRSAGSEARPRPAKRLTCRRACSRAPTSQPPVPAEPER